MTRIQMRRDTSTNWSVNNPTPANGEPCYETDTRKFKIGDGVTKYTNLPYQGGGGSGRRATIDDSTTANMVTTDTAQDITANKTFYGEIRVGADNNYATLAKFSKEALVSGSSTLSEHIDLGEADFVVQGNLGKKVYDTDKYVYKKYINVDDLSDNQIAMDNSISSQVAHMAMPSDKYIDLTLGASGTTYTAPADGYFLVKATVPTAHYKIRFENKTTGFESQIRATASTQYCVCSINVSQSDIVLLTYDGALSNASLRFYYTEGSKPVV